jgi:hypothetical protein
MRGLIRSLLVIAALVGAAEWFAPHPGKSLAVVWLVNGAKEPARLEIGGKAIAAGPDGLGEEFVEEGPQHATLARGAASEALDLDVAPAGVTVVDVAARCAFVLVDVSSVYNDRLPGDASLPPESGFNGAFPIAFSDAPGRIHKLPYNSPFIVKPGRPLPDAIAAVGGGRLYKLFLVEPARLADRAKLARDLTAWILEREARAAIARAAARATKADAAGANAKEDAQ